MEGSAVIFGKAFEYDFLSGWIKYNRLQNQYSLEALAYGICSTSHLSYFENGKKKLRGEIIESLLEKLNINDIKELDDIGLIRQKFYNMMLQIESLNYEAARNTYNELKKLEYLLSGSPYNIEFKIYQFMFNVFVEEKKYEDLEQDIQNLDKIYNSLSNELKHLFTFVSGKVIYQYRSHSKGIERLETALALKETPWINYQLGFSYCFNGEYLKATYYMEKALESYEQSGRYINAIWCHNYLGIAFSSLRMYEKAESHLLAALTGADHFNIKDIYWHVYCNLSHVYFGREDIEGSIHWVEFALKSEGDPLLPIANYVEISAQQGNLKKCKELTDAYLLEKNKGSKYYYYLYFLYLSIFHLNEDLFYQEITQKVLPHYESTNHVEICNAIKLKLVEHLETKRKYKEANRIYKDMLSKIYK